MEKKKIILPKLRYENAPEKDTQIRIGIEEEKKLLRNNDRDIVIDLAEQFASERAASLRYKLYGKIKMIFRNLYAGASHYNYLRERLALVGDGSDSNFCGFLPYNEFAFLRDDVYYETPELQSVSQLSGVTPFNLIMNGSTEHQAITTLLAPYFNWNMYLTYVYSHEVDFPMKYTLSGDTEPVLSFVSGDGIPFRVQEEINKYVLISPVKHGMAQGEYVLIDGVYYYINSVGNQIYRSEEYVINILKSQVKNVTFNTLVTGKRCTDIKDPTNTTSEYYVHKHKTLTSIQDYIIDKVGFESPIWEDEQKRLYENSVGDNDVLVVRNRMESVLFDFKEPFVLSGITNNLGYTPTDLYVSIIFRNQNGYFNYPPKVGYSFHMHDSWIDEHFDGYAAIETGLTFSTFELDNITFLQGNEAPDGTELYGSFVEYNPKEMKERIISEAFHKIISNPLVFNHGQTLSTTYSGASITNPIGLFYQPHYRYKIRELSPYIETSDISTPIENLPENAVYFPNEKVWRWRDLYDDGYIDPDGYGTDYPYLNDIHYIHKNINFYLRNEVIYLNKKDSIINFHKSTNIDICDNLSTSYLRSGVAPSSVPEPSSSSVVYPTPPVSPSAYVPSGDIYLSPIGDDYNGNGTESNPWFSLNKAWENVTSGNIIYMMGGTYEYNERQYLTGKNGEYENTIKIYAYPGQTPIITRSDEYIYPNNWPFSLVLISGDYLDVKGLEIAYYSQLTSSVWEGIRAYYCNHCNFELLNVHHNGAGMRLTNCDDCLVLNSDFHHNQDPLTSSIPYVNADGFGVDCLDSSINRHNTIRGCRFWWNSDDGIDAWNEESSLTIENCWSFWNGFIPDTFTLAGDGNGYKLGRTTVATTNIRRYLYNNISYQNRRWGFLDNQLVCNAVLYNNIAYLNGYNNDDTWEGGYYFNYSPTIPYYLKNNIAFNNETVQVQLGILTNINHNSWDTSVTVTNSDFISINSTGINGSRSYSGSLPALDFLKLASGSDLIRSGISTGMPTDAEGNLWASPPSMGPYESSLAPSQSPSVTPSRTPSTTISKTPSRTPSVTPSIGTSQSRTPSVTATMSRTPSRSRPITTGPYYYVSADSGVDSSSRNGSISQPWATLSYASTRVTTGGSTIYINPGDYSESGQILLASNVSVEGAGKDVVTMVLTYSSSYPSIKLETPSGWGNPIYGNQSISGIRFDGDLTGIVAIGVNFRSNVHIHDCEFVDFRDGATFFNGQPEWEWTLDNPYNDNPSSDYPNYPDSNGWCTGNKFYNNTISNCARYVTSDHHTGALSIGTQDGFEAYGNNIDSISRNGYGIKFWSLGFNKNSDLHDNTILISTLNSVNRFAFGIELWWELGGTRIYNNIIRGSLDLVGCVDTISAGYSVQIYNNDIGRSSTPITLERGILLEGKVEYVQIFRNHIHHVATGIYVPRNNYTETDRLFHVDIYSNLLVNLGQNGSTWQTWGMYWPDDTSDEGMTEYLRIQNNVFHALPQSTLGVVTAYGVMLPRVYRMRYIYVDNNIILNFYGGSIHGSGSRTLASNVFIRSNIMYGNGYNNDPNFDSGFNSSLSNYTYSGTIKSDPGFISIGSDYHLAVGSVAIASGTYVGLLNDYDARSWLNPPSIGAYEFASILSRTPSPSRTFSKTPSITPTKSISSTPFSTPSRTSSITPTKSITRTASITPSRTPSRSRIVSGGQIIANHNVAKLTNLQNIPNYYIIQAQNNLLIAYNHTSHGSQIIDGMSGLVSSVIGGSTYRWIDSTSHASGYLSINDNGINGWWDLGYADDYDMWETTTRDYLYSHPNCNVIMWSWCGELSYLSSSTVQTYYLDGMVRLQSEFPSVNFVYMTGHLDGTGSSGNLHQRNEQIRAHVAADSNRILFDFADIERYDPNNTDYLNLGGTDGCDYSDGNWAINWQDSHTEGVDWYNCSCAHSQPLNGNMKTYAAWYLWSRMAGWSG